MLTEKPRAYSIGSYLIAQVTCLSKIAEGLREPGSAHLFGKHKSSKTVLTPGTTVLKADRALYPETQAVFGYGKGTPEKPR